MKGDSPGFRGGPPQGASSVCTPLPNNVKAQPLLHSWAASLSSGWLSLFLDVLRANSQVTLSSPCSTSCSAMLPAYSSPPSASSPAERRSGVSSSQQDTFPAPLHQQGPLFRQPRPQLSDSLPPVERPQVLPVNQTTGGCTLRTTNTLEGSSGVTQLFQDFCAILCPPQHPCPPAGDTGQGRSSGENGSTAMIQRCDCSSSA